MSLLNSAGGKIVLAIGEKSELKTTYLNLNTINELGERQITNLKTKHTSSVSILIISCLNGINQINFIQATANINISSIN